MSEVAFFSHLAVPIIVEVPASLRLILAIELGLLLLLRGSHRVVHVHHHRGRVHGCSVVLHLHVGLVETGLGILRVELCGLIILAAHLGCLHKVLGLVL